jgi:hypothetical protein
MCAMAHRDFKGSVVLMSTNHTTFPYPVHRSYHESHVEAEAVTMPDYEDTIVGGTYFTTDEEDTDFDPNISAGSTESDSDAHTQDEGGSGAVEDASPAVGSVISSQQSLVGTDYGDESDSNSSRSSLLGGQPPMTRLQRQGATAPLAHECGLSDPINVSDYSSNDSSDTDTDTSDDDVMYYSGEGEETSINDYAKQKHTKTKSIPTKAALVSHLCEGVN